MPNQVTLSFMEAAAIVIFTLVYLGMVLGFWPGFALDRRGLPFLAPLLLLNYKISR